LIGRVRLEAGREQEALSMIGERGAAMLQSMAGSKGGYWARTLDEGEVMEHSFWLFDSEANARSAERTFNTLRELAEAPAALIGVDVCEVVGQAPAR
jgi:hypothetical protein